VTGTSRRSCSAGRRSPNVGVRKTRFLETPLAHVVAVCLHGKV
jgi:hypothetical protein